MWSHSRRLLAQARAALNMRNLRPDQSRAEAAASASAWGISMRAISARLVRALMQLQPAGACT